MYLNNFLLKSNFSPLLVIVPEFKYPGTIHSTIKSEQGTIIKISKVSAELKSIIKTFIFSGHF